MRRSKTWLDGLSDEELSQIRKQLGIDLSREMNTEFPLGDSREGTVF